MNLEIKDAKMRLKRAADGSAAEIVIDLFLKSIEPLPLEQINHALIGSLFVLKAPTARLLLKEGSAAVECPRNTNYVPLQWIYAEENHGLIIVPSMRQRRFQVIFDASEVIAFDQAFLACTIYPRKYPEYTQAFYLRFRRDGSYQEIQEQDFAREVEILNTANPCERRCGANGSIK